MEIRIAICLIFVTFSLDKKNTSEIRDNFDLFGACDQKGNLERSSVVTTDGSRTVFKSLFAVGKMPVRLQRNQKVAAVCLNTLLKTTVKMAPALETLQLLYWLIFQY